MVGKISIFGPLNFRQQKKQYINNQLQNLTNNILQEKMKINPETNKIEEWQRSISTKQKNKSMQKNK